MKNKPVKLKAPTNLKELTWASGLFEGEGWISFQGSTPSMGIQSSDKPVLERFSRAIGGGKIKPRKPRIYDYEKIQTRKPQWAWTVTGFEKVQAVVAFLWYGLSERRRERASEILLGIGTYIRNRKPSQFSKGSKRIHGTVQKYWQGCRCSKCRRASIVYSTENKKAVEKVMGIKKALRTKH